MQAALSKISCRCLDHYRICYLYPRKSFFAVGLVQFAIEPLSPANVFTKYQQ